MSMANNCQVRLEKSMLRSLGLSAFYFFFCFSFQVQAQTLEQALSQAYVDNPELSAARVNLRKINEGVSRAKAGWRPTV